MPILHTLKVFRPALLRIESREWLIFYFGTSSESLITGWRVSVSKRRFQGWVSGVLWCNVWAMNVRWRRVKDKPGAGISLLLSKSIKVVVKFNALIRRTNPVLTVLMPLQQFPLRNDTVFHPGIFETKIEIEVFLLHPPTPIPVTGEIKNSYSPGGRIRKRCMRGSDSISAPQRRNI